MGRAYMRLPLGRAIGLGLAKGAVKEWWAERVSAVALGPVRFQVEVHRMTEEAGGRT